MRIAICFRGIARSLQYTIHSIEENIVNPCKELADVRIFTHLFDQKFINNERSGEYGLLNRDQYKLLKSDWISLEEPLTCLSNYDFDKICDYGDTWDDNFISIKNLIHELHSLKMGWEEALKWRPDIYIFLRPDIYYHDSFRDAIMLNNKSRLGLTLPYWQGYGGCNDRFAIATTAQAAESYASRVDKMHDYCRNKNKHLHAEVFLKSCIENDGVNLFLTNIRATRIRSNGKHVNEDFSLFRRGNMPAILQMIKNQLTPHF